MISKEMLELLFRAASMQRWNDHIRPHTGFSELDKQSHKMVFAYMLAKTEESDRSVAIEWQRLIEGGIFEFLQRSILTEVAVDHLGEGGNQSMGNQARFIAGVHMTNYAHVVMLFNHHAGRDNVLINKPDFVFR